MKKKMDGDLEFGLDSGTVTKTHGSQSIRKNISLKLKQNTVGTSNDAPKSMKREKRLSGSKSVGSKGGGQAHTKGQSFSIENLQKNKVVRIDNKVNLIGEKVVDPLIHTCEKCLLPILIYGRLMPCKHVFCFSCAKKYDNNCLRCSAKITRIEQSALGTVFVCTVGGSKHGVSGCQRTYLSQRDLQSHIQHRHVNQRGMMQQQQHMPSMQEQLIQAGTMQQQAKQQQHTMLLGPNVMHPPPTNVPPPSMEFLGQLPPTSMQYVPAQQIYLSRPPPQQQPPMMMTGPPHGSHMINVPVQPMMIQQQQQQDHRMGVSAPQQQQPQSIVVMASRSTNLITVPIQDENFHNQSMQQFQQDHYNHQAAGNQFVMQQQQQTQQQQQQQVAQQQAQQQNQQQITLQQAQFVMGQSQLMNRSNLMGQGHLRPQNAAGGQMVNQQMVPTQMNIHAYQRFDDPNQHAQFISTPQGVSTNSWLSNQIAQQQRPPSAGTNQQIQYF